MPTSDDFEDFDDCVVQTIEGGEDADTAIMICENIFERSRQRHRSSEWSAAQLAWKPPPGMYGDGADDPLTEIDATIRRARSGDLQALGRLLASPSRPVLEPEPKPPEAPYVPAHLRFQQQQEQARLRAEGNLRSRLVRKEVTPVYKTIGHSADGKEFVITSGAIDRYNDTVEPAGLNFDAFKRNPVALFAHDHAFCIGAWRELRLEGNAVKARLVLAQKGISPRLDEIRGLVDGGFLRACSIGFLAHEQQPIANGGIRFTRTELCEISLVTIPANSSALVVD